MNTLPTRFSLQQPSEESQARRFARRRDGYIHALNGGIWDDPFRWSNGSEYRHIVSTNYALLAAWCTEHGLPVSFIQRRDLRDVRNGWERVQAWHVDLGGPLLGL